jgi:hypothetical protein
VVDTRGAMRGMSGSARIIGLSSPARRQEPALTA